MDNKDEHDREDEKNEVESTDNVALVEKALKSFCCYLYVGKDLPYYKAKPWNDDGLYPIEERLQCLEILASNKQTELVPIDKIKLAMDTKLARRPTTLMFALAKCARQKKSDKLRAAAYYFLVEHCKEWEYFILFIKHAAILSKMEGRIGWGRGWKNAVNKWYLTKDVRTLSHLVTTHKGDHGWTHKDIFKLSHPETAGLEVEKQAIFCYIMRGLEKAIIEYSDHPEALKTLKYIETMEFYKHCQSNEFVTRWLENGDLTMDQAHPQTLMSKDVWRASLKRMDVRTILKNIPRLNKIGLLTEDSPVTQLVVDSLRNESNLMWNEVLPGDIMSVMHRSTKSRSKAAPPYKGLCTSVHNALESALDVAKAVTPAGWTKKKYLVSVRLPPEPKPHLETQAALAIALPLFDRSNNSDPAVTIVRYDADQTRISPFVITEHTNFADALRLIQDMPPEQSSPMERSSNPMGWVCNEDKKYDVFIAFTAIRPTERDGEEITRWRKISGNTEARLIHVVINQRFDPLVDKVFPNCLTINGFDENVPWVIEAYVRGLF